MPIPMIDKLSSFLHQYSLVHQLSLMQKDMETLAQEEAHFMEVTGKTISLLSARQERREPSGATVLAASKSRYA